jgi:hypothetical protein
VALLVGAERLALLQERSSIDTPATRKEREKRAFNRLVCTNARMRRSVARLDRDGRRVNFSLTYGHPVPSTLRVLRAAGAELVVVGPDGASAGIRFLLGSVSHRLLTLTDCDTLIVPRVRLAPQPSPRSPFARPFSDPQRSA